MGYRNWDANVGRTGGGGSRLVWGARLRRRARADNQGVRRAGKVWKNGGEGAERAWKLARQREAGVVWLT